MIPVLHGDNQADKAGYNSIPPQNLYNGNESDISPGKYPFHIFRK